MGRLMAKNLTILLGLVLAASSCDPLLGSARVGLSTTSDGKPRILYAACPQEEVQRIALALVRDNLGGGDDHVLWEIEAVDPQPIDLVVVAPGVDVPEGFATTTPLTEPLPEKAIVTVAVYPPTGSANASSFELRQLRSGRILTDIGTYISHDEFLKIASDTCDNRLDGA